MATIFTLQLNTGSNMNSCISQEPFADSEASPDGYSMSSLTPTTATHRDDNGETQGRRSFYMDLMGDHLSTPPERFRVDQNCLQETSLHGHSSPLTCTENTIKDESATPSSARSCSKSSIRVPERKSFYAELMDGHGVSISKVNGQKAKPSDESRESDITSTLQVVKKVEKSSRKKAKSSDESRESDITSTLQVVKEKEKSSRKKSNSSNEIRERNVISALQVVKKVEKSSRKKAKPSNESRESGTTSTLQVVKEVEKSFRLSNPPSEYYTKDKELEESATLPLLGKTSTAMSTWEHFQAMNPSLRRHDSSAPGRSDLRKSDWNIPMPREHDSLSGKNLAEPGGKDTSQASISSSQALSQSGGREDVCMPRPLSVIIEESEEHDDHDDFDGSEQPWSQLLPWWDDSSKALQKVHAKQSSANGLDDDVKVEDHTVDIYTDVTLTFPEKLKVKDSPSKVMVMPLFQGRPKMTLSQTLQVAGLMVIGAIFVAFILAWVFSPVIFGV
ncbi:hypothetical protein EGW08_019794 [Elysia chlorotica]|uniref:Uncharacterized protein n=1 Tax=Elysia chlorotica TaxID=188477 RepID=A0A3S1H581_ELYCH|nr:hypothetical protein EGW08_019794 [Elysia chlorotica]